MKKEITLTKRGPFDVMVAPDGYYLTQASDDVTNRVYPHERMLLAGEQLADWRIATDEEKAAFEAQMAKHQNE